MFNPQLVRYQALVGLIPSSTRLGEGPVLVLYGYIKAGKCLDIQRPRHKCVFCE
jgi:hypothetical protein